MRPVIKYISFYDFADSGIARNYSVAAANKMDYIIESLVRIGYDVEVVSASACIESGTFRWYKSRVETASCENEIFLVVSLSIYNISLVATYLGGIAIIELSSFLC